VLFAALVLPFQQDREDYMESKGWHQFHLRIRYQETDQMGVVYHANYLNWFEIGRTEMMRSLGVTYKELEARGLYLPVTGAEMSFKLPAHYDDVIAVYTKIADGTPVRMQFISEIRRISGAERDKAGFNKGLEDGEGNKMLVAEPLGELLVSGKTRHVWLNRSWKPVRLDREAPDLYRWLIEQCK
jgi:acyl-CoA thioester hydrolase